MLVMKRQHAISKKGYFTVKEAAAYLGIKRKGVYSGMRIGSLPFHNLDGHLYITLEDMDKYKARTAKRAPHKDGLFTAMEAADYLGVKPVLLYVSNKFGKIKSEVEGEHIYFTKEALDAYMWLRNLSKRLRTPTSKDIKNGIGLYEIPAAEGRPGASIEDARPDLFVEMETPERIMLREEFFEQIVEAFKQLDDPKKQHVLKQRIIEERTLEEIASDLSVTRERIRQLEEKAMPKLRSIMRDMPYFKRLRFI